MESDNAYRPTNRLEAILALAASDPGHRPEFYRELLLSEILVLGSFENPSGDPGGEGARLTMTTWWSEGGAYIPVFSSIDRLREAAGEEIEHFRIDARLLLEMVPDDRVILNPRSVYGKEFLPAEIRALLDGSIFGGADTEVLQQERRVFVGRPTGVPTALVSALATLFAKHPNVEAGYLGQMVEPDSGMPPHSLIGVKTDGPCGDLFDEIGAVIRDTVPAGEVVDVIEIRDGAAGEQLPRTTQPFYFRRTHQMMTGAAWINP